MWRTSHYHDAATPFLLSSIQRSKKKKVIMTPIVSTENKKCQVLECTLQIEHDSWWGWRIPNMKNLQQFPELRPSGVKAGDWVEFGNAALCGRVKAFRFSSHFKENFLFLQFSGKFFFQRLRTKSDCQRNKSKAQQACYPAASLMWCNCMHHCKKSPTIIRLQNYWVPATQEPASSACRLFFKLCETLVLSSLK